MVIELCEVDGGVGVVAVRGDVDLSNHLELHELVDSAVSEQGLDTVVLDVSGLAFIDSHGVRALMLLQEHTLAGRAVIVLREPRAHLLRLLQLTGVSELFPVESDEAAPELARGR